MKTALNLPREERPKDDWKKRRNPADIFAEDKKRQSRQLAFQSYCCFRLALGATVTHEPHADCKRAGPHLFRECGYMQWSYTPSLD